MVDVRTVGAGGGSIASIDAAGMLKVGPESAGSTPGPICFGRGGERPTITDANLILGRLPPERLLAVDRPVAIAHVRSIFEGEIARPLGFSVEAAAAAVLRLASTHMAGAIRMVSLSRGYDPRDFVLFAFGGAGPLHACSIARELAIPEVLVPARPGLTNALGCLVADLRQDFVRTLNVPLDQADMSVVAATLRGHEARGREINAAEQDQIVATSVLHSADMQFRGQTHLIRAALPSADVPRKEVQRLFEDAYFKRFHVKLAEIKAVLVNLNTSVIGRRRPFPIEALMPPVPEKTSTESAIIGERRMFADGNWHMAKVYAREKLPRTARVFGPAIIEQVDATTVVEPEALASVDSIGNLRIAVDVRPPARDIST
jgi:N-methylhydantoinase A